MRRALIGLAAALLLAPAAAPAADDDEAMADAAFAEMAAQGNRLEIELGKLAAEQAQDAQIRNYGERMAEDHAEAQKQLAQAARHQGIELPDGLSEQGRQTLERLSGLSGEAFDRAYAQFALKAHTKDLHRYEEQSQDPDSLIQAYATDLRPIIRKHREIAGKLNEQEVVPAEESPPSQENPAPE